MPSTISVLLLCKDTQALYVIDRITDQYDIETVVHVESSAARDAARTRRFDLMVLDFDLPGASGLLECRTSGTLGHPSLVIALGREVGFARETLSKQISFVIQKPFTGAVMEKTVKAAYRLIVKEKRAMFRRAVRMDVTATIVEHGLERQLKNVTIQDISYRGLCIKTDASVPENASIFLDFQLPDTSREIHAVGNVIWSDPHGQVGIEFRFIAPQQFKGLRSWLAQQCPWDTELPVVLQHQITTQATRIG